MRHRDPQVGRRGLIWAAALATIALVAPALGGGDDKIEVRVMAIRATKSNDKIDGALKELAEELRKKGTNFTGFKVEKRAEGATEMKKPFTTPLAGDYSVKVTPLAQPEKKRIQFEVELTQKKAGKDESIQKTTVTAEAGKFILFTGGMKLDGGDELIAAVAAR